MTLRELRRIHRANKSKTFIKKSDINEWRLPIVAVSYCWLSENDPDPRGDHLRTIGAELDRAMSAESKVDVRSARKEDWGKAEMSVFEDVGVFFDYSSMDQKDQSGRRSEEETARFRKALQAVNTWYNHPCITVFLLMGLPDWYTSDPANRLYEQRGWPLFEKAISVMNKRSSPLWWDPLVRLPPSSERLIDPPLTPEAFNRIIGDTSRVKFTEGADANVVMGLYGKSLVDSLSSTDRLAYTGLRWSDDDVSSLTQSFASPLCNLVKKLHLEGNAITDVGVRTLCTAVRREQVLPNLTHLFLEKNQITDAGADELAACLGEMTDGGQLRNLPKLESLHIDDNRLGDGGKGVLRALVASGRLRRCVTEAPGAQSLGST